MRWNSGSFGHDFTYVRIHSPVRMCGSLRDVRKKACFLVRDKTQCAQIYCKNDVADYKKEIHGYKKWELFSILFIIPYLCRVFHADTSVRGVWESGKYIYIEKTFTWRFVLGTLKLRKFLTCHKQSNSRCLRDMLMFLFHLCWSKRYSSCTYRRGLLRCSFGQGGQCEGLKVQDE